MRANDPDQVQYDVIVVGAGVAGALAAYRLARARYKVLIIEAGGVVPESSGRQQMVEHFMGSPGKSVDSPFCGKNILAPQPAPPFGENYYVYTPGSEKFKSTYERLVGGSTWHWQGLYLRMLPNDFRMQQAYGVGFDWPLRYDDLVKWYAQAEDELGVSGSSREVVEFQGKRFKVPPYSFPMDALRPSYLDQQIAGVVDNMSFDGVHLKVTTVPHATNSRPRDGRPACSGYGSCVPLCPSQARYDATIHVKRAVQHGAKLLPQCVVSRLETNDSRSLVTKVWYRPWKSTARGMHERLNNDDVSATGKIVVLAANGMENPMILLRSGICNSSGAVGRYLMDHLSKSSYALMPEGAPVYPFRGPTTTSHIEVFRDGDFRRSHAAFKTTIRNDGWGSQMGNSSTRKGRIPEMAGTLVELVRDWGLHGRGLRHHLDNFAVRQISLGSACEQLPYWHNRVTLSDKARDALGFEKPLISYRADDDSGYLNRAFSKAVELHHAVFDALGVLPAHRLMNDDGVKTFFGSSHIMGTTIMGTDPNSSVVNKNCSTHQVSNLFILGSSVFPTGSTANATSTIAALALRAANHIHLVLSQRI